MVSRARLIVIPLAAACATAALAACSSGSSGGSSASPTTPAATSASPTSAEPTPSPTTEGAPCTSEALQATLPSGSTIVSFECASVTDQQWAGGKATAPGGEVVWFAKADAPSTTWQAVEPDEICGTASAGLPPKILALCPS